MKIAVTGATGFIGQNIVAELERRLINPILVCLPNSEIPLSLSNHFIVHMDLKDPPTHAFDLMERPDVIMHLAWGGLPNYKSLHHFEEELPAQYRLLKGLVESGLQNLLVTGTCFEYGMQAGILSEDLETRPNNPYGFAKDTLHRELKYLQQINSFNLTWARLFYLYGDGQSKNSLFTQLKNAVERKEKVFNMSGGEQLRDYLPVAEVAKYLVTLALNQRDNGIVNVCSGRPISVRRLVEGWIEQKGWSIKLNLGHHPYPDYEQMAFWGNNEKIEKLMKP
ncbi:MAG: epimerase [Candidatus Margulisbacteria bacterium GWF2_35_9]|nr:MAG: epimerase [Candidatus Margulisbacteria bacterium GWF2_35_9]